MPKCTQCGNNIIGQVYEWNNKKVCYNCYSKLKQEADKLDQNKKDLYAYLREAFGAKEVPPEVISFIDREVKNGKTFNGIKRTIWYAENIAGKDLSNIDYLPIIIKEQYENARAQALEEARIKEINSKVDLNIPPDHVKINPKTLEKRRNHSNYKKIDYNMEDL